MGDDPRITEAVVEVAARAIHDTDDMANTVWPDGTGDDGYRGGSGYVRVCLWPDLYRDAARNALRAALLEIDKAAGRRMDGDDAS